MTNVRIWSVESIYGTQAVKYLVNEWATDSQLGTLASQTTNKKAFLMSDQADDSVINTLTMETQHYLQQDARSIFITDLDNPMPIYQLWGKSESQIYHIEQIVDDSRFTGKAFLARTAHEFEARLPVVCKFLEVDSTAGQDSWDNIVAPFHEAFADTPEEEVMRDFEEALAEVRRERI